MKFKPNFWQNEIGNEERFYKEWAALFLCNKLEDYWEGKQWQNIGGIDTTAYKPYVLNMIFATIKIKLANIIFQRPQFLLSAMPGHGDWDVEMAGRSAEIKEAALNTLINHPKAHFVKVIRLAALDSFLRGYGIIETDYAADWQNPNKPDLVTKVEDNPDLNGNLTLKENKVTFEEDVPQNERLYYKHIKARRFRVSTNDDPILDHCNWCGYYSFIKKTVLAQTEGINLPTNIKNEYFAVGLDQKYIKRASSDNTVSDYVNSAAYFKVWKIWDNRRQEKKLVIETEGWPEIWKKPMDRINLSLVSWDDRAPSKENIGFYPVPPVFHWISPQDEINQAREQLRNFRKRAVRKFWFNDYVNGDEVNKLSNNTDGEAIKIKGKVPGEQAVGIIANPEAGSSLNESLQVTTADLNVITGTSANARQQTDRTTATESKIIDERAAARESVEQMDFSQFICDIGRESLLTMIERFTEGMWVKMTLDPSEDFGSELQDSQSVYQYIENQQITDGSYDWDISLDVVNATPAQMAQEQQKLLSFLQVVFTEPQIALSPILLREVATKMGYKNERVIRELQKAATMKYISQLSQQQGAQGQQSGGTGQQQSMQGNGNPNPQSEIVNQLRQQIGM